MGIFPSFLILRFFLRFWSIGALGSLRLASGYLFFNLISEFSTIPIFLYKSGAQNVVFRFHEISLLRMKCHNLNYILVWNMVRGNWCMCVLLRSCLETGLSLEGVLLRGAWSFLRTYKVRGQIFFKWQILNIDGSPNFEIICQGPA